jgi:steroid 5-alpha reductase family enzyme
MREFDTWFTVNLGAMALAVVWGLVWSVGAVRNRRNDIIDVAWGLWFPLMVLLVGGAVMLPDPESVPRTVLVFALLVVWGCRLSFHIARRAMSHAQEDKRYAAWRRRFRGHETLGSILAICIPQPLLGVLIAQPVLIAAVVATDDGALWWLDLVALLVTLGGILLEASADRQLRRFLRRREDGRETGRYLTRGAWAWSRHPNYAGDAITWIGFGIFGISASIANDLAWMIVPSVVGPLVMWWFLRYGSGVPLTERDRAGNAEWDAYVDRTGAFWPRPPRQAR